MFEDETRKEGKPFPMPGFFNKVLTNPTDTQGANMEANEISYALAKQIGSAHTISSNYGDIQLDDEMKAALQRAIRPILEQRLAKAQGEQP
jgi:hypothetical protein